MGVRSTFSWRRAALPLVMSVILTGCGVSPAATGLASRTSGVTVNSASTLNTLFGTLFHQLDAKHDGRLTRKELDLSAAQFRALDLNGDGAITEDEWNHVGSNAEVQQKLPAFRPLIDALRTRLDTNHDGKVSIDEINAALKSERGGLQAMPATMLAGQFDAADAHGDKQLDAQEFETFYLNTATAAQPMRGLFGNIVQHLLGTYVSFMGRIAANKASHPGRRLPQDKPNMPYENVAFQAADGLNLKGWYIPAAQPSAKTLILVHGISDCRDYFVRTGILQMVHPGYNVLAFDLRNHGESDGTFTSFAYYEGQDVVAAANYLKGRGNTQIAVLGVSLGAASSIRGAALDPDIKAVIDDCSYATVVNAFTGFISRDMVPSPMLIAQAAEADIDQQHKIQMETTEPLTQMPAIAPRPLLIIHGQDDINVSPDNAEINFVAAGTNLHKELWIVPGAGHAASATAQPAQYQQHVLTFLQTYF